MTWRVDFVTGGSLTVRAGSADEAARIAEALHPDRKAAEVRLTGYGVAR